MSKIRIGDRVQIKSSGEYLEGIVLDRIVNVDYDNRRCEKLWLVKPDGARSFSEYMTCTRKDIGKLGGCEQITPLYVDKVIETPVGRYRLLLVGRVEEGPRFETTKSSGTGEELYSSCVYDLSVKKTLTVGWAVCSPQDEWDWDFGFKIALHRAKTRPFTIMYTTNSGEFDNRTVVAILKSKLDYFREHWRRFITIPDAKTTSEG